MGKYRQIQAGIGEIQGDLTSPTELPVIAHAVAATPAHGGSATASEADGPCELRDALQASRHDHRAWSDEGPGWAQASGLLVGLPA